MVLSCPKRPNDQINKYDKACHSFPSHRGVQVPAPIALTWRPFYKSLMWLLFGRVDFAEREEYQEFRYKLVIVLMTSGALVTGFFILGTLSAVNPISPMHQKSMILFTLTTTLLWLVLRGHPQRFLPVGWIYEFVSLLECTSS